jgi:hypothetical protein
LRRGADEQHVVHAAGVGFGVAQGDVIRVAVVVAHDHDEALDAGERGFCPHQQQ